MNAAPIRRQPLGCLKAILRQTRQQRLFVRSYASTAPEQPSKPASSTILPAHTFYPIPSKTSPTGIRTAFAVYASNPAPPTRSPTTTPQLNPSQSPLLPSHLTSPSTLAHRRAHPLPALHALQQSRLDPTAARASLFSRTNPHAARVGDVLMVTTRRGAEPFSGVCLSIRRRGIDTAILLRGQLTKVGVEMWFKIYSRNVAGVEIIHRRAKRARRARLMYMRQPKHDMGSVDGLVQTWRRSRQVLRTRGGGAAAAAAAKGAAAKGKKDGKK